MKKCISILATIAIFTLTNCEKEGKEGIKSLFNISTISPNADCLNGGQKIESGLDKNRNSLLDDFEVESTSYICNGTNGSNGTNGMNSLTNITEVSASSVCEAGGFKIDVGLDNNRNNILDAGEIESTKYICNGNNGNNGNNSLLSIFPEPQGDNCSSGGYKVVSGIDINNNNSLDNNEIQNTEYVCNGDDAIGNSSLIDIIPESIEVFNGKSPKNWTELDLSTAVGKNYALVIIKVYNLSSSNGLLALFRQKGDISDYIIGSDTDNMVSLGYNGVGQAITYTDSIGKIEWKADNSIETKIEVVAYAK